MGHDLLLAFIPIFFAVDPIGALPIFCTLTKGLNPAERRAVTIQSLFTAVGLAVGFLLTGRLVFRLLGLTMGDFMIAGGAILFCLAMIDLIVPAKNQKKISKDYGAVPIGTPLVVGPAVLTISLMLQDVYGLMVTMAALLINLFLVGVVFIFSEHLIRFLGEVGTRVMSKVMSLLLASIGVMMIRRGFLEILPMFLQRP
ncbi:MAG: MarC family protein [Candidatus Omnitrophota bacterium]|nr:MarC family protein [Candidatus Omnitrophota bacterium]MDZ4243019.1 MarC family protein [Candidatus Omnitrophota bacterium]